MVADAGPLIAFGRIQRLELLPQVLGEVLVPHAVAVECLVDPEKLGARAILDAFSARMLIETPDAIPILDAGESAAIRAEAVGFGPHGRKKAGRKIATNLGLSAEVVGSAGVLLAAKKRGLIESARPILDTLAANGYHFPDALVRAILTRAGER